MRMNIGIAYMLYFFRLMIPAVAFGLLLLSGVACNKKRDEVRQIAVEQPDSERRRNADPGGGSYRAISLLGPQ